MLSTLRTILGGAALAALAAGCGTSPPGAGLTNGDKPTLTSDEKAGIRDDLHDAPVNPGDAPLADAAATQPGGASNNAGTGGRNMAPADQGKGPSAPAGNPPQGGSPAGSGAQGGTKPADTINTGTPRSPQ
jgi:hypothetical protein